MRKGISSIDSFSGNFLRLCYSISIHERPVWKRDEKRSIDKIVVQARKRLLLVFLGNKNPFLV